jgi:hypothetical protein
MKKAVPKKRASDRRSKKTTRRPYGGRAMARPRGIVKVHPGVLETLISGKPAGGTIAPGFTPHRALNLKFMGGRTIPNLSFRNFYLGGSSWSGSDIQNIDKALSGAMADPHLNNVMLQYFPSAKSITTKFLGSEKVPGGMAPTYTRDSVNSTLESLMPSLSDNTDFDNTVICLFLPPGMILTDDAAGGVGRLKLKGDDDDAASSKQGLGGYHGSCHVGDKRVYFAVGVYSQFIGRAPNGIPIWPDSWKNIVATFYHELNEARTDPDVEESERQNKTKLLGWYANVKGGGEVGDIPMSEAGNQLNLVMVEVPLVSGGTAPIQLMWSNAVSGPEGPFT